MSLGADAIGAALPIVPAPGTIVCGARIAEQVADVRRSAQRAEHTTEGGLNLFKWGSETTGKADGWKQGDYILHLPDQGSPKANWKANAGRLREEMKKGKPIYDSYRDPKTGKQLPTDGFLRAPNAICWSVSAGATIPATGPTSRRSGRSRTHMSLSLIGDARRYFDPVAEQFGLSPVEESEQRVRYEGKDVVFTINLDSRRSYEVGVDVRRKGDAGQATRWEKCSASRASMTAASTEQRRRISQCCSGCWESSRAPP